MIILNAILVSFINSYGRIATWRGTPAEAIKSLGYGYDYDKTDA